MSDSDSQREEAGSGLPGMLEELRGDNPTIWGVDYYKIIYGSAGLLAVTMAYLYVVLEDPELKKMVLVQGGLSVGLLCAALFFRSRIQLANYNAALAKRKEQLKLEQTSQQKNKRKRK